MTARRLPRGMKHGHTGRCSCNLLGGMSKIALEHLKTFVDRHAFGLDTGHHMDLSAADRLGIGDALSKGGLEFGLSAGQGGKAPLAGSEIADQDKKNKAPTSSRIFSRVAGS